MAELGSGALPGRLIIARPLAGWVWFGVSVALYALIGLIMHQPFHDGSRALRYFDLRVYIAGAHRVVDGLSLYATPIVHRLGFTYPPFAAVLFVPLAYLSDGISELLVTAGNLGLLLWLIRRTARIRSHAPETARACRWSRAAAQAAALIWLEPISVTLGYGQVDLLIAALVVFDISRPDSAGTKGVAIGVAAGIKLTPLLFIPYLLLSGRRRAAAWATASFAVTVAISFAVTWRDAAHYWTGGLFLNSARVGNFRDDANQSLEGALARLDPGAHPNLGWHLAAGVVALAGVLLAVRFSRRGDEAAGFSIAALTTLLVSPVSWSHHWTLAVPALLLLAHRARARRVRDEVSARRLTAAVITVAAVGYAYLPERWEGRTDPSGALSLLTGDAYVLIAGVALLVTAGVVLGHRRA